MRRIGQIASLPNLITLGRLFLTPFAVHSILAGRYAAALAYFMLAGLTDGIDGFLARRFNWITTLGAYLDPIVDKVLLSAIFISLGVSGAAPWWLVGIIFGRDILLVLATAVVMSATSYRNFRPSVWGKLSTIIQIVTAVAIILNLATPAQNWGGVVRFLIFLTGAATVWSGFHYFWRAVRELRRES